MNIVDCGGHRSAEERQAPWQRTRLPGDGMLKCRVASTFPRLWASWPVADEQANEFG